MALLLLWGMCCYSQTGKLLIDVTPLEAVVLLDGDTVHNRSVKVLPPGVYLLSANAPGREPLSASIRVYEGATMRWGPTLKGDANYEQYLLSYKAWAKKKRKLNIMKVSLLTLNIGATAFVASYVPISANKKIDAANSALKHYLDQVDPTQTDIARSEYLAKRNNAEEAIKKRNTALYVSLPILAVAYGLTVYAFVKAPKAGPQPQKDDFGVVTNFKINVIPNVVNPSQSLAGISFNF